MPPRPHDPALFRVPPELARTPTEIGNVLVVGSCVSLHLVTRIRHDGIRCDYVPFNNLLVLPSAPPGPPSGYDCQVVQVPLRSVLPPNAYFRLPLDNADDHAQLFADSVARLRQLLRHALRWTDEGGIPTFVTDFMTPQQNPIGRLLPRFDLRNPAHFVHRLNEELHRAVAEHGNAHVVCADEISASFGRNYFQDDIYAPVYHNALLLDDNLPLDQNRLEPPMAGPVARYGLQPWAFLGAVWAEVKANLRTLRGQDQVKLVIVDLDDTLWRGLVVETGTIAYETTDGWPVGIAEALLHLKRRGVLLAIVSKNDAAAVERVWDEVWTGRLSPDDFAARQVNWDPKPLNVERVLAQCNLLPRNTVFIDDNPAERDAVQRAFPDIRVLGDALYDIRRILLWAPETQVPRISAESARRTDMVRAQLRRDEVRATMSREDFLLSLDLRVEVFDIAGAADARFARALELLNKTNQFNTTGRRWTEAECAALFAAGGTFHAFEVRDRFTRYGLAGLAILQGGTLLQFVLSCRVIGLDVELVALRFLEGRCRDQGCAAMHALFTPTDANGPCRDLFPGKGYEPAPGGWRKALPVAVPVQ